MLNLSRRSLVLGAASLGVAGLGFFGWRTLGDKNTTFEDHIAAIVDTIIPRDETAGALDLKLDQELLNMIDKQPQRKQKMMRLINFIKETALHHHRRPFSRLSEDDRVELLTGLLTNTENPVIHFEMHRLRNAVMTWYYRSAEAHSDLGYTQPNRYPAYPGAPRS